MHDAATKAESLAYPDSRTACFHARRGLEVMVHWLYKHDAALRLPYQDNLSALIHEPTFKTTAGVAVFAKTVLINRLGNQAVHGSPRPGARRADGCARTFPRCLLAGAHIRPRHEAAVRPRLRSQCAAENHAVAKSRPSSSFNGWKFGMRERNEKLSSLLADKTALDAELTRLRVEVTEAKKANTAQADTHNYSEAETRDYFIDLLLKEAGLGAGPRTRPGVSG